MSLFGQDEDSNLEEWSVVDLPSDDTALLRPSSKPKPSPKPAPKYRFSLGVPRANWVGHSHQPQLKGLAPPAPPDRMHASGVPPVVKSGLPAPQISVKTPRSLQPISTVVTEQPCFLQSRSSKSSGGISMPEPDLSFPGPPKQRGMDPLVRCKQASQSPVVQQLWKSLLSRLMMYSTLLQEIYKSPNAEIHVARLFDTFAASTIVKYLNALGHFLQICVDMRADLEVLSEIQLADILLACRLSRSTIQGMSHVNMVIKALRWAHRTLQLECLSIALGSMITSFSKTATGDRRESLPFSLFSLMHFERRILMRECQDWEVIVLGMILLLAFSGLRFSDMQRTCPSTLHWNGSILRGTCWRTKTSRAGQPFGLHGQGFLSKGTFTWLFKFLTTLDAVFGSHGNGHEDYLIPGCDRDRVRIPLAPMTYAEALYFVRSSLKLPWRSNQTNMGGDIRSYTVHGLKSTLLSWGQQLELPEEQRRLQGKHKPQQSSTRLYSRDDVFGALKFQESVIRAVREGFRPSTPLGRGGQHPMEEPKFELQLFNKTAPEHQWQYFQFGTQVEILPAEDPPLEMDEVSDSDTSSSSTSSSNSSSSKGAKPTNTGQIPVTADEIQGALHRNMWHVASESLMLDDGVIRTACGRRFPQSSIAMLADLQLSPGQQLCSHPGCLKGWKAVGAI